LQDESQGDVIIVVSDPSTGQDRNLYAWKHILEADSEYFACSISSPKFNLISKMNRIQTRMDVKIADSQSTYKFLTDHFPTDANHYDWL